MPYSSLAKLMNCRFTYRVGLCVFQLRAFIRNSAEVLIGNIQLSPPASTEFSTHEKCSACIHSHPAVFDCLIKILLRIMQQMQRRSRFVSLFQQTASGCILISRIYSMQIREQIRGRSEVSELYSIQFTPAEGMRNKKCFYFLLLNRFYCTSISSFQLL